MQCMLSPILIILLDVRDELSLLFTKSFHHHSIMKYPGYHQFKPYCHQLDHLERDWSHCMLPPITWNAGPTSATSWFLREGYSWFNYCHLLFHLVQV